MANLLETDDVKCKIGSLKILKDIVVHPEIRDLMVYVGQKKHYLVFYRIFVLGQFSHQYLFYGFLRISAVFIFYMYFRPPPCLISDCAFSLYTSKKYTRKKICLRQPYAPTTLTDERMGGQTHRQTDIYPT